MELLDLPLFPLGNVVFPGFGVQLHIFEPRYQELLADCQAGTGRFGVVGIRQGIEVGGGAEPYQVGTLVQISEVKRLMPGHFYLAAAGLERIQLSDLDSESKPYLRGRARLWPDDDAPAPAPALQTQAGSLFNRYLERLVAATGSDPADWGVSLPLPLPDDPRLLSWLIAALIQVPPADKQALLETPAPAARLELAVSLMGRELALIDTTQAAPTPNPATLRGSFSNN